MYVCKLIFTGLTPGKVIIGNLEEVGDQKQKNARGGRVQTKITSI